MSPVGNKIKRWRIAAGLRQEDIEAKSNGVISQGYLSDLERGRVKDPGLSKMAAIVEVLGRSLQDLISDDDEAARRRPVGAAA